MEKARLIDKTGVPTDVELFSASFLVGRSCCCSWIRDPTYPIEELFTTLQIFAGHRFVGISKTDLDFLCFAVMHLVLRTASDI